MRSACRSLASNGLPCLAAAIAGALLVATLVYRLGAPALFEDPNDGQYAEVAREMLETGDWVSPQLDYVLFLNKPPLLYWLVAASYRLFGVNEAAARLPGTLITAATLLLLYGLGRELFDRRTAGLAVLVYAALPSTLNEARFVRPDALLTATIVGALWAFAVAARTHGGARLHALYAMQVAFALGVLSKGPIAVVLPAVPIACALAARLMRGDHAAADLVRALLQPRAWLLGIAIIAPWHIAVALRHPGFAWDYVVQQHVLFFLDRKEPRDSTGISLAIFAGALLARCIPWTVLVPAALWHARRHTAAALLVLAWVGGGLVFFAATPARLEHYVLPLLPGIALLLAAWLRDAATAPRALTWHLTATIVAYTAAMWLVPAALSHIDALGDGAALADIARTFFGVLALGAALALLLVRRWPLAAGPVIAVAALALYPEIHRGLSIIAPCNSSAPVAAAVRAAAGDAPVEVVSEAPVEYQLTAGLGFYLRRRIHLLRPAGFVEPSYLIPHRAALFIDRAALYDLWSTARVLFVTDPLAPPERDLSAVVPAPFYPVARVANRWVLSNWPLDSPPLMADARAPMAPSDAAAP